jgi:hypothetical protein
MLLPALHGLYHKKFLTALMIFLRDTETQQSSRFLFTVMMNGTSKPQTIQRLGKRITISDHIVSFMLTQKAKVGAGQTRSYIGPFG